MVMEGAVAGRGIVAVSGWGERVEEEGGEMVRDSGVDDGVVMRVHHCASVHWSHES